MAAQPPLDQDTDLALALAVVGSSTAPTVLLDEHFRLTAASASFFSAFHIDPANAVGRSIFDLGSGEWNVPQLRVLLKVTARGVVQVGAYEMDLKVDRLAPRRLVIDAKKLDYGNLRQTRILLSVADVTDARLAEKLRDDLLQEKAFLLKEIQHRVANSLQIIASVILQSTRRAQSNETRNYLRDAHNRVMSVANLQHQLARSRIGDVELKAYFDALCESIGASMIRDPKQLSLRVDADDSAVHPDISVSLGLVVTELVINALKHAFPGGRSGAIVVGYRALGEGWTLSVTDNGVGMPKDAASATPGLGTSIVSARANQLNADVQVKEANPGTAVSLISRVSTLKERPTQEPQLGVP